MTPAVALMAVALALVLVATALLAALFVRERHRARAAERRARAAVEARDAFFDLATHELRSPLAAILGYQELLQEGAYGTLDQSAEEPVRRIGRSARHLLHLIDGVVELGRLRSGGVHPDIEPVNTGVLISALAEAFRTQARDRGLDPRVNVQGPLPLIRSDPDRLLRALDLFMTSALKHPDGAALHLDARSDGHDLRVRIHPIDLRLPPDDDPELRLGIRLAIADHVATLLGGELRLETAPDRPNVRAIELRVKDLTAHPRRPGPP